MLPLYLDLKSKKVTVFGGGAVGYRKALYFGEEADVTVVSKEFIEDFLNAPFNLINADIFDVADEWIAKSDFVVAAADSCVNDFVAQRSELAGKPYNRSDSPGSFLIPSLVKRDNFSVAISTYGNSPAMSRYLKVWLDQYLDEKYDKMIEFQRQLRDELKKTIPNQKERERMLREVLEDPTAWSAGSFGIETVISAHITHKQTEMSTIDNLGKTDTQTLLDAVCNLDGVSGAVVLKTCNRIEAYISSYDPKASRKSLENLVNSYIPFGTGNNLVQYLTGKDSIKHLIRVSCGLESMIIGEDQILGQVKNAYDLAESQGVVGPVLSVIFRQAISAGKKVRTETKVNKGSVSVGSAAVELAEVKFGDLSDKSILIVGAGETASLIAKHLIGKNPKTVFVSNRTYSNAVELAFTLNGIAVRFDNLLDYLKDADVVLCATSAAHNVLKKEHFVKAMESRNERTMMVIDVSFPRNVDPESADVPGVELYDIDGLRELAEENILKRRAEIKNAETIIDEELSLLDSKIREMKADDLLGKLYTKFDSLKCRELKKAKCKLRSGNKDPDEILEDFCDSLSNKFLADITCSLKEASRNGNFEMLDIVSDIFCLRGDENSTRKPSSKAAD